ncbi:MAG: ribonuclease P protein component [Akkermansiaceae bacterium]|nr:ribonuclease P protein component [Akkermansiaceae bacterium]
MIPATPDPVHSGAGPLEGFRLPRSSRIRRSRDIRELLRRGKRKRTSHLDVFFRASPVSRPRLGFVVPRHRRGIVDRNRLKRRLREVGRTEVLPRLHTERANVDVLIRARREAYQARFSELKRQIVQVTESICSRPPSWG